MAIRMAGIDHENAPIDIRTVFSFTKKSMAEALETLKGVKGVEGCVMISTCNRMELYLSTGEEFDSDIYKLLCDIRSIPGSLDYRSYFHFRQEREAVHHLFRLAAGLESRILGDDQIVTQVKDALGFSREHYAADHVLETLFRMAVTAAKKVKTRGALSSTDQSAVHAAIQTLKKDGYTFAGKKCMVIGNGVMGKLAATELRQQGADVTVTVRQYRSGVVEIPPECSRIDYGRRMELLGECDYVLSATVSPNYTLTRELVEDCRRRMSKRKAPVILNDAGKEQFPADAADKEQIPADAAWKEQFPAGTADKEQIPVDAAGVISFKPIVLIDLAVPRDIDPSVAKLDGVRLYDIDCFREEAVSEAQKQAIADAELLFEEQMKDFFSWYECLDVIPKIQTIKEQVALDLEKRLTKELRSLPLPAREREALDKEIEAAAERTMNKLLFGLRGSVSDAAFRECIEGLEKLYDQGN